MVDLVVYDYLLSFSKTHAMNMQGSMYGITEARSFAKKDY